MKSLEELRREIDAVDKTIAEAYAKRLALVREVGAWKKENGACILQSSREGAVLENAVRYCGEDNRAAAEYLFREIMDYSKEEQRSVAGAGRRFLSEITAMPFFTADEVFRKTGAKVACQGVEGAYSHIAAYKVFASPEVVFFKSWRDVFRSVSEGGAEYGVLPIENSTAGSVNEVYDLLKEFGLKIVAAKKVRVEHCLLGVSGAKVEGIQSVASHPQALTQCKKRLDALGIEHRVAVSNTAVAAKSVAEKNDPTIAAIASELTAELYGLNILSKEICDADRNFTRFIVVSKEKFMLKEGNRISLMLSIEHREGALKRLLSIFSAFGKNLLKLESRPVPDTEFEFLFYVDLSANARDLSTQTMLARVGDYCNSAVFLGGYRED